MASIFITSCYNPVLLPTSGFAERSFCSETSQAEASSSNRPQADGGGARLLCIQQPRCSVGPKQILHRHNNHEQEAPCSSSSALASSFATSVDGCRRSPRLSSSSGRSGHGAVEETTELRVCKVDTSGTDTEYFVESILDWQTQLGAWKEYPFQETATSKGAGGGVPVFIMLPLDSVSMNNTVTRRRALNASLVALKSAGVEGVMMDVWWGIVEKDGPRNYNWSAYKEIIEMVRKSGLKVQAVMSFHQCGANVGDSCKIPLPPWVTEEMQRNPDIAYTDKAGRRNHEYVSLGCDTLPVLKGRTPIQVYADFMRSFRDTFEDLLGDVIVEIQCGLGPAGEMRYPSYPEDQGKWRFPGIGQFQCYDKYMMASLKASAYSQGKPHWGLGGPHDAGHYNQMPEETGFFRRDGSWQSEYGQFFLEWYSQMLLAHGERVLSAACGIFCGTGVTISGKIAGIHWHYGTRSHAAELTAGYYNTRSRDGYLPIAQMFAKHGITLNFTCIEMKDIEQPANAVCSPENLVRQVAIATRKAGIRMAGENALPRFDAGAHHQIVKKSRLQMSEKGDHMTNLEEFEPLSAFTFLRMCESLFRSENWNLFVPFVRHMEEGRTFHPWEEDAHTAEIHVHATRPFVQEAASLMYH